MFAGLVMELNLPLLETLLTWFEADLAESLDGKGHVGQDISGSVDNTVSTDAEQTSQFKTVSQDHAQTVLGCAESIPDGRGRRSG